MSAAQEDVEKGYAVYSPRTLRLYDWWVLRVSTPYFWQCPIESILGLYRDHLSENHLEVGVGTGYFLGESLPEGKPRIVLLDANRDCLDYAENRLAAHDPEIIQKNVLEPLELDVPPFDSIAVNYLLHCLPGTLDTKAGAVFDHLAPHLADDGTLFGSSILGSDVQLSLPGRLLMAHYNRKGIFSNRNDSLGAIMEALSTRFRTFNVEVQGCVVLFWGKGVREGYRERLAR